MALSNSARFGLFKTKDAQNYYNLLGMFLTFTQVGCRIAGKNVSK